MTLYEKLMEARRAKGLSQNDVAEELNVSRQTVSNWEVGANIPSLDNMVRLSRLYEVSMDELLSRSDKGAEKPAEPEVAPDPKPVEAASPAQPEKAMDPARRWKVIAGGLLLAVVILAVVLFWTKRTTEEVIQWDELESIPVSELGELEIGELESLD